MLADTMFPEAFEHGGQAAGLLTTLGFAVAYLLSTALSRQSTGRNCSISQGVTWTR